MTSLRQYLVQAAVELELDDDFVDYLITCSYRNLEIRRKWFATQGY